jgi:PAS domain S-box-containing protein
MPSSLAAIARLTDALSRARTLNDVYDAALDALARSLGVERASILLFDADNVMSFVAWRQLSDAYRSAVRGHTPWTPASVDPQPICVEDVELDASLISYLPIFRAEGIRALGFFPLGHRDRVLGKFMVYHAEPHVFAEAELELARTIATQIAFGIARVTAEQELDRERARLAGIIASVPGVVWETIGAPGQDQQLTFVSEQITQLLGYSVDDWYGDPHFWSRVIVEPDELVQEGVRSAVASGRPGLHQYRMRTRDGRLIWTEVRAAHKLQDEQLVIRGVTIDVTARVEAEQRGAFLGKASAVLAASIDHQETLKNIAELLVPELADWCVIDAIDDTGRIQRLALVHRDPAKAATAQRILDEFPPDRHEIGLARRVVESRQPEVIREITPEMQARLETLAVAPYLAELGYSSWMIVPLAIGDRCFGAISLVSASPERHYGDEDLALAMEVAHRAAYAVDNARLLREAQQARARAEEAERRSAFLANASAVLSSSLDYQTTLAQVARLAVSEIAEWCIVDLVEEDGEIHRVVCIHRDVARASAAAIMKSHSPRHGRTSLVRAVVESGEPRLTAHVPPELWEIYDYDAELKAAARTLGLESFMIVPLVAGGRSFGALSLLSGDPARRYSEADLVVAAELGRRAAYAIDNARLYQQAQEANHAKDEFLATLSHELRTPMTATLGWATMLRMSDISPENFHVAVETIERSTKAQAKLIDEILDVSRIVTGKLELSLAPVQLQPVIEAAAEAIRPTITAKDLRLQFEFSTLTGTPLGDAGRLQQVIWNLLSNAVKFTPSGGSIHVSVDEPAPGLARIVVRDSGQGVPKKFLPFIFERFRQADGSSTRQHGGLGLGLAIVKNIVELHNGTVSAASEGEGKGAAFTIILPLIDAEATASRRTEASPSLTLAGVDVLLVEDEEDTRLMIAAALRGFGAQVTAVDSAAAAFAAMESATPAVVVSDIAMPGEDGCSFIARLRTGTIERIRNVPAVALTAYARDEDRTRILACGFGYHLSKPVDPVEMAAVVRRAAVDARAAMREISNEQ